MTTALSKIFVSYRRSDSSGYAGRLFDYLSRHFGRDNVFIDVETIGAGADFVETLEQAVASCAVMLPIIGKEWIAARTENGSRRIDICEDFVHREIAAALALGTVTIPVLVNNAKMPSEADLPTDLKALARRNAVELSNTRWERDVAALCEDIEALGVTPAANSSADEGPLLRTLVASELVGFPEFPQKLGETRATEFQRKHDRLVRDLIATHHGREIDKARGFLHLFDRPLDAVVFALVYHENLTSLTADLNMSIAARIGMHLDEVYLHENSPEDITLGARPIEIEGFAKPLVTQLMSLADPGRTLLTNTVFDFARRAAVSIKHNEDLQWLAHGRYLFTAVDQPIDVFEVALNHDRPLQVPADSETAKRLAGDESVLGWRPAPGPGIPGRTNWNLERKLGEGGFGEVWLARQAKTGERRVFKFCFEAEQVRSLRREVTLFRLLKEELGERPDIARILDWNFDEPPFYLESEYTIGGSLVDWAAEHGGLDNISLELRLELVAQTAEALAAAHSVAVLHKDIKPQNILVARSADGDPQARLTDFGIGLVTDRSRLEEAGITVLGLTEIDTASNSSSMSGTRLYMAPEILEGRVGSMQGDIYSLGVVLYQMVVGDLGRALAPGWQRNIDDPMLVADITSSVDGDPEQRLASAGELATRLRRLEERRAERAAAQRAKEETIRVKATLERSRRRQKLGAAALAFLVIFASAIGIQSLRIIKEKERAEASHLFSLGRLAGERSQAIAYAIASLELADNPIVRHFALKSLWNGPTTLVLSQDRFHAVSLQFSSDGRKLALGGVDGRLQIWSDSGELLHEFKAQAGPLAYMHFSPTGEQLLTSGTGDRWVHLWSLSDGSLVRRFDGESEGRVRSYPADDWRHMLTESTDYVSSPSSWRSWNISSGEVQFLGALQSTGRISWKENLGFATSHDNRIVFRHRDDLGREFPIGEHETPVKASAFSPDGSTLASFDCSGEVRLWPLGDNPAPRRLLGLSAEIPGPTIPLIFDSSGQRLAIGNYVMKPRIWSLKAPPGADPVVLDEIYRSNALAFSPDSHWVATAEVPGALFWAHVLPYPHVLRGHSGRIYSVELSPDGRWAASTGSDGTIRLWPTHPSAGDSSRILYTSKGTRRDLHDLHWTADSRHVICGTMTGSVLVVDMDGSVEEFTSDSATIWKTAIDNSGRFIAASQWGEESDASEIHLWNLTSGTHEILDDGDGKSSHVCGFIYDGRLLAAGGGIARLWDPETLKSTVFLDALSDIVLDRSGRLAVAESKDGSIAVLDVSTGKRNDLPFFDGLDLTSLAIASDGRFVVAGELSGVIRVVLCDGDETHLLFGHEGPLWRLGLSADNQTIVSAGWDDGTIRIWQVPDSSTPSPMILEHEDFVDGLRTFTNLRVRSSVTDPSGYTIDSDPFPGWAELPRWPDRGDAKQMISEK